MGPSSMKNSGLSRGTPHYGLVATLFVVMSILAARSSLAQTVTLDDNRPPQAAGLSAPRRRLARSPFIFPFGCAIAMRSLNF